jgi:hypothetical protein
VKFDTTPTFDRDIRALKPEHLAEFKKVVLEKFAPACDAYADATECGNHFIWPRALRVSKMRGRYQVWEMTWSFASPDGRATFEFVRVDNEWRCRWRRLGDHSIYNNP